MSANSSEIVKSTKAFSELLETVGVLYQKKRAHGLAVISGISIAGFLVGSSVASTLSSSIEIKPHVFISLAVLAGVFVLAGCLLSGFISYNKRKVVEAKLKAVESIDSEEIVA